MLNGFMDRHVSAAAAEMRLSESKGFGVDIHLDIGGEIEQAVARACHLD
jgi:hypothetical protein